MTATIRGPLPRLRAKTASGGTGLLSARYYISDGAQVIGDGTGPVVLVWGETFDDIGGIGGEAYATGNFYVPVEGDYLITAFGLCPADPAVLFPGGGRFSLYIANADNPGTEQQGAGIGVDDIPKHSLSTVLRLHPATPFQIAAELIGAGSDGILDMGSCTITQLRVLAPEGS